MPSKSSSGPSVWELLLSKLHKNYKLLPSEQKRIYETYSLPQPRYLAEETITLEDKRQIGTIIETMQVSDSKKSASTGDYSWSQVKHFSNQWKHYILWLPFVSLTRYFN